MNNPNQHDVIGRRAAKRRSSPTGAGPLLATLVGYCPCLTSLIEIPRYSDTQVDNCSALILKARVREDTQVHILPHKVPGKFDTKNW